MALFSDIIHVSKGRFIACGTMQEIPDFNDTSKVIEKSVILETNDYGANWSIIYSNLQNGIRSIHQLDESNFLVLDDKGKMGTLKKN